MRTIYLMISSLCYLISAEERILAATTYSDQDLMILMERSQIRGEYQDVCNERNGALITNARELTFYGTQFNNSPFRDSIYVVDASQGYVKTPVAGKIKIDLMQTYEINTVLVWLYDVGAFSYNIKITLTYSDATTQDIYTNAAAAGGIYKVPFDAALVQTITLTAVAGSLSVIKIQAFYAI